MREIARRSALGLLLLLASASVRAVPITFQYSGPVVYMQLSPEFGDAAPAQVGDRLVMTYTFQSDAPGTLPLPWRAVYSGQGPLLAEILREGSRVASWTIPSIDLVVDDNMNTVVMGYPGFDDRYNVTGELPDPAGGTMPFDIKASVLLLEHEYDILVRPTAIQGTALPLVPPDPAAFEGRYLALFRQAEVPLGNNVFLSVLHWYVDARIDSFATVPSIPEPSTVLLFGAGLAALGLGARSRRAPG